MNHRDFRLLETVMGRLQDSSLNSELATTIAATSTCLNGSAFDRSARHDRTFDDGAVKRRRGCRFKAGRNTGAVDRNLDGRRHLLAHLHLNRPSRLHRNANGIRFRHLLGDIVVNGDVVRTRTLLGNVDGEVHLTASRLRFHSSAIDGTSTLLGRHGGLWDHAGASFHTSTGDGHHAGASLSRHGGDWNRTGASFGASLLHLVTASPLFLTSLLHCDHS